MRQATLVRRYGAAVIVMAFDEQGQADTVERKVDDLRARLPHPHRAGRLPARGHHLRPEHLRHRDRHRGARRLRASRTSRPYARIKAQLPHAKIIGGVSATCRFSFRGNEPVRKAIHAVFLYHAIRAGMDMGIVNAGALPIYDDIEPELRERVEDVVLAPPAGRDRAAARDRGALREGTGGRRDRASSRGARCPSRSGCRTRSSTASTRSSSTTPRRRGPTVSRARSR